VSLRPVDVRGRDDGTLLPCRSDGRYGP